MTEFIFYIAEDTAWQQRLAFLTPKSAECGWRSACSHTGQTFKLSGEIQTWALTFEGDKVKVHSEKYRRL